MIIFIIFTGLFLSDLIDTPQWWTNPSNWFWLIVSIHGWSAIGYFIYYEVNKIYDSFHPERKSQKDLARKKAEATSPILATEMPPKESDTKIERFLFYKEIAHKIQVIEPEWLSSPLHMKLCPFCGAENRDTARFCVKCNVWLPE
jgi:hypothetical protein